MTDTDATVDRRADLTAVGMGLAWWAGELPDTLAIIGPTGTRTFPELNANANRFVRALRARGLEAGDPVALLCSNRPAFAEVVAGCLRGGFRLTTINWHLTADEAAYIADDCEAKALISDAGVPEPAAAAAAAPAIVVRLAVGGDLDGYESYESALGEQPGDDIDDATLGNTMLYTSGTTGRPKGVRRNAPPVATAINLYGYVEGSSDRYLCTGPLYHAAPLAFSLASPLAHGVGVVLMEDWDAEETLRLVDEHKITHTHMVPTMFHRLISLPPDVRAKYDTSSLRHVLHGAAPCPVSVKAALIEWLGPIVVEYYAATEGVGSFVDSKTWLTKPGTVGRPFGEGQVIIGDEEGDPLPADEVGLVYLKAPPVGRFEYFKDAGKTDGAYRGDYFTLGDVGYLDGDGFLFLTDRTANLIISGGVNIYPAEVDAVLLGHPAVGDVATIGVPNSEWGEEVKAVVELQPGLEPSDALAAELIEYCRDHLSHFKCPRTVAFIARLPRQDNGKIYKRHLRDQYRAAAEAAGATRDSHG
jgi:long-chain acyl-CoA synthetase